MRGEVFERFKKESVSGLFLDFDGTLSEIVDVPSAARPMAGVPELLAQLAARFRVVAVVSGRSAHELLEWLGPEIEIWGLHGAEHTAGGKVVLAEDAARFESMMQEVYRRAESALKDPALDGVVLENKGAMVTFHYRMATEPDLAVKELDDLVGRLAEGFGLVRATGKFAFELQPPVSFSKRKVVLDRSRQEGLKAACFAGDDVVDLPGYDAIDELEASGVVGLRVAVDSAESPEPLIARADVVVDGPRQMMELLREFL